MHIEKQYNPKLSKKTSQNHKIHLGETQIQRESPPP